MLDQCCYIHADQEFENDLLLPQCRASLQVCAAYSNAGGDKFEAQVRPQHTFANGSTYTGDWLGLVRHGSGVQVWPDGARYEGQWQHDMANGIGRFEHCDGDVYEGEWKNDKANGRGIYMHASGSTYIGEWQAGRPAAWLRDRDLAGRHQIHGHVRERLEVRPGLLHLG